MTATDPKATLANWLMNPSHINQQVYIRSYRASQFLRRHRFAIILGAFVFWSLMLWAIGYFREFEQADTGFLIFGFFWMTVPMALATYFIPRILLRAIPLMNGYKPEDEG